MTTADRLFYPLQRALGTFTAKSQLSAVARVMAAEFDAENLLLIDRNQLRAPSRHTTRVVCLDGEC